MSVEHASELQIFEETTECGFVDHSDGRTLILYGKVSTSQLRCNNFTKQGGRAGESFHYAIKHHPRATLLPRLSKGMGTAELKED